MFGFRKRIFAGKQGLSSRPFCPYLSDESGYLSLLREADNSRARRAEADRYRDMRREGQAFRHL